MPNNRSLRHHKNIYLEGYEKIFYGQQITFSVSDSPSSLDFLFDIPLMTKHHSLLCRRGWMLRKELNFCKPQVTSLLMSISVYLFWKNFISLVMTAIYVMFLSSFSAFHPLTFPPSFKHRTKETVIRERTKDIGRPPGERSNSS